MLAKQLFYIVTRRLSRAARLLMEKYPSTEYTRES